MKLTDIILKEGVEKRMTNFLDDLHSNKCTISVEDFMKEFGVSKDEAIDFIHKWNMSKVDRSVANEAFDELDDGFDQEMEDLIKAGPRLNKDRFEDVIYYIHNNWMAGNYGDDYAIKRISKYLNAR